MVANCCKSSYLTGLGTHCSLQGCFDASRMPTPPFWEDRLVVCQASCGGVALIVGVVDEIGLAVKVHETVPT